MPSEDLSSVIKLHPPADKLLILFPFEWDNTIIVVFFGVTFAFREIVPANIARIKCEGDMSCDTWLSTDLKK